MDAFIEKIDEARKAVKSAERTLSSAEIDKKYAIKSAEREVKDADRALNSPQRKYFGVKLYVDRIEYLGKSYPLNDSTDVQVDASGERTVSRELVAADGKVKNKGSVSVAGATVAGIAGAAVAGPAGAAIGAVVGGKRSPKSSKTKVKFKTKTYVDDTRQLFLTVSTSDGTFVVNCVPSDEARVRQFAAEISSACIDPEGNKKRLNELLEDKKRKLEEVSSDDSAIEAAQQELQEKKDQLEALTSSGTDDELAALAKWDKKRSRNKKIVAAVITVAVIFIGCCIFLAANR